MFEIGINRFAAIYRFANAVQSPTFGRGSQKVVKSVFVIVFFRHFNERK